MLETKERIKKKRASKHKNYKQLLWLCLHAYLREIEIRVEAINLI